MAPKVSRQAHPVGELDEGGQHELEALGEYASQDEVNAIYRRFVGRWAQRGAGGGRPARPWPQRPAGSEGAARAPPRTAAGSTCPNCTDKGHTGSDCSKPKIELDKRKCFLCNPPLPAVPTGASRVPETGDLVGGYLGCRFGGGVMRLAR